MQTDMFMNQDIQNLAQKIEKVEKSTEKVRKGLFGRNTALEKNMILLESRFEEQQNEIYRLKLFIYGDKEKVFELKEVCL